MIEVESPREVLRVAIMAKVITDERPAQALLMRGPITDSGYVCSVNCQSFHVFFILRLSKAESRANSNNLWTCKAVQGHSNQELARPFRKSAEFVFAW